MSSKLLTIITDQLFELHDTDYPGHPETYTRLQVIRDTLLASPFLSSKTIFLTPSPATREDLLCFHTEDWLFRFEEMVLSGHTFIDHIDNQVGFDSYRVALLSAGAGITGIKSLEDDPERIIFCLNRPPGHHAEPDRPYGFCFFNNVVIAVRFWQRKYDRKRICVFDFDAHHGNGVQSAFEEDEGVLYVSIHEDPRFSYPGTGWDDENGMGKAKGLILNNSLMPGSGDAQLLDLFDNRIKSRLLKFKPEAIVVAAGFDAHHADDMSGLNYSEKGFFELGKRIGELAFSLCHSRIISIMEGGYHLPSLGSSVESYLSGLVRSLHNS